MSRRSMSIVAALGPGLLVSAALLSSAPVAQAAPRTGPLTALMLLEVKRVRLTRDVVAALDEASAGAESDDGARLPQRRHRVEAEVAGAQGLGVRRRITPSSPTAQTVPFASTTTPRSVAVAGVGVAIQLSWALSKR